MKKGNTSRFLLAALTTALLVSCENDIETINLLTQSPNFANLSGKDVEVIYSDSARVKVQMLTPELKQFTNVERPYLEFPKGMRVFFYDDSSRIESEIVTDYCIYYNEDKLWQAKGNVVARNLKNGNRLNTEELFWDENKALIYSSSYTRIENEDGTFYGQGGFESDQNLTRWTLIGSKGTVNVRDEE
ncbi:MAG: LPS export ABC transporter periplasmic protein LptC [Bacteroidota bacterium]